MQIMNWHIILSFWLVCTNFLMDHLSPFYSKSNIGHKKMFSISVHHYSYSLPLPINNISPEKLPKDYELRMIILSLDSLSS